MSLKKLPNDTRCDDHPAINPDFHPAQTNV